jgi:hypothetical protein
MLIEFKAANFRSIREEQKFSLVAGNTDKSLFACEIGCELPGLTGVKFLKGAAIYGANASGKSNILAAMRYMAGFVLFSATRMQPGDKTGAQPFKLDGPSAAKPSEFEITFVADGLRYLYGFAVTPRRVVEEYLVAYPKGMPQRWFHRTFNPTAQKYDWDKSSASFKQDKSLQDKTRENSLYLSVGPQFNHPQLTPVFHWFNHRLRFTCQNPGSLWPASHTAEQIAQPARRDRLIHLLRSANLGLTDAAVREREMPVEKLPQNTPQSAPIKTEKKPDLEPVNHFEINLSHQAAGLEPVAFDFDDEESAGTRRFFTLIGPWLEILDQGCIVFLDEIETSLHPNLVKALLSLVFSAEHNPKGAQIIFTTHNPIFLDHSFIRRDQVWFTEKSPAGATHLYPLTDYEPRPDESLAKGYLAGRYGAVPFLKEGLTL